MENTLFSYTANDFNCHHSITTEPEQSTFQMHAHDKYELFYYIGGAEDYLVEGARYRLYPGDVMIMRGAETHKILINDASKPYERFSMNFSASFIDGNEELLSPFLDHPLGTMNRYSKDDFRSDFYKNCIENMFSDDTRTIDPRLNIKANLIPLLIELKLAFAKRGRSISDGNGKSAPEKLIEYVNGHLFDDISLSGMSDMFYLSQTHINRTFKRLTGSTLWNYVKIKRLLAAREMISAGKPAGVAASACGYSDYSAFYRAYVARFGTSPTENGDLAR